MIATYLWETGSLIMATMGLLHLRITFRGTKLFPRDEKLMEAMKLTSLRLTKKVTFWKSWIGFNATHSSGAIFIGVLNLYLAVNYFTVLESDLLLTSFTVIAIGFYVWVAHKFWFKAVLISLLIAWACFLASYILMLINR